MKKIRFLSILIILLLLSCDDQADIILHDDLQSDVKSAKDFFINEIESPIHTFSAREGKSRKSLNKNLLWEKAYYKSTSFGQVVIVPIMFDQPLYLPKGDQSLSLDQLTYAMFHKNETGYELYWVTALPDQEFQNNNDGLNAFTGTVFVEDWYGNYIQGFRYEAGGVEKIESDANSRMNGECEVVSVFYCSQVCDDNGCGDITCEWSHNEVTCPDDGGGMPPSDNPGDFPPDENGTGGSGDGPDGDDFPEVCDDEYVSDGHGGCVEAIVIISPDDPIEDMIKYLECFDVAESATVTIYVKQPIPNDNSAYHGTFVGHTFVSFSQNENTSVFGFYPATNGIYPLINPSDPSSMGNDSGDSYDVSVSIIVSGNVLENLIDYSINYPDTYHLDNFNCSDFGIQIGNIAGLNIPDCYGTWPGGGGSNPGALGQHLRNMNLPDGSSRNSLGGNAPNNQKNC